MSTIFELIDSGDVERIRAKLADDPAAAAAHDELGLTVVMRAAYRGADVLDAVRAADPPLEPFDRLVERRALDLARLERLDDVADFHVVEVREVETAFEAFLHLARIVLEPLERVDRRRVDHRAVADHPRLRAAADDAVCDHAAGDRSDARRLERVAHFRLADRLL